MDSVKNRDRRKLLTCLKPETVDHVSCYAAGEALPDSSEYDCHRRKKNRAHRSFSGALKAVFVKSSLAKKKLLRKTSMQDSFRSSSYKSENFVNTIRKNSPPYNEFSDSEEIFTTNSNSSITASTRSSISSNSGTERTKGPTSLDSKDVNTNNKQESLNKRDGTKCIWNPTTFGMCIFSVCLFALVFGGKPFAIMTCTSMCLFFAPSRRSKRVDSLVSEVIVSDEYKKRVIMEGLLERSRSRFL